MIEYSEQVEPALERHTRFWSHCKLCPLHRNAAHHVLGRGRLPCDVVIVGEAPGNSENAVGEPFVGREGWLLDELIYASGSGWTYFITNVVACLPLKTYGKDIIRVPTDEEAAACNPRLQAVIEMAVPKGLVLLGKVAKRYARNLKVERRLELVHPSFILRNGGVTSLEFKIAKRKLTQFVKELQS